MRLGANRDGGRPRDPDSYWRRRFFILGGGIAVLAVLAWQFTGARPATQAGAAAAARSSAATLKPGTLPSAAYGSPWAVPSPTPPVTTIGTTAAKASATATPGPSSSAGAAANAGRCAPPDIVLSLFPGQPVYAKGAHPRFDVFGVSSAVAQCQLPFGPGSVRVVVTRHGRVVWDSAACWPAPAPTVRFEPGVPRLLTISWNRAAKHPAGCAGSLSQGEWGTFNAVAESGSQSSPARSFRLLR